MYNGSYVAVKIAINGSFTSKYNLMAHLIHFTTSHCMLPPALQEPQFVQCTIVPIVQLLSLRDLEKRNKENLHLNATGHNNSAPSHRAQDRIHSASLTHVG